MDTKKLTIIKRCKLNPETLIRAHGMHLLDNNHSFAIVCLEAWDNYGVCPKGRRYSCEFRDFTNEEKKYLERPRDGE